MADSLQFDKYNISGKRYLLLVIVIASFFSFWKLGVGDISEWDEAEYGTIAFEMLHNGDYVNYYYAGEQDTRNGKPPLMIWSIILFYKIFGFNAWSLRLPSAIASILFFVFAFRIIALYKGDLFAFVSSMILLSCKIVIGFHVGRTGDTDALLIFFLAASLYYFLQYLDFRKRSGIYLFAIFTGLAFYTKGTGAFVLIPGMIIYSLITNKWKHVLWDKNFWLSFVLVISIVGSWLLLLFTKGNEYNSETSWYGSHNALETLFKHDTFARLTNQNFEPVKKQDWMFFFSALDIRFNIWNYLFFIALVLIVLNKKRIIHDKKNLIILSFSLIIPFALLLTFAATKHEWYIAPLAIPISIITTEGLRIAFNKNKIFAFIWIGVFGFNIIRQITYINSPKLQSSTFFLQNKLILKNAPTIHILDYPTQDILTYLHWNSNGLRFPKDQLKRYQPNDLIFFDIMKAKPAQIDSSKTHSCLKNYCFVSI
jgi:4-amino-4-deoxy-L-arabinose transferase-like glycosyltransferase